MKWIGQHIYDLISRFRSDVYLEDIDTGTIASGGNLGLDSKNKIVKATVSGGGISHDGSTADGVLTFKDADEATVESNLTYDGADLTAVSSSEGKPVLTLKATHTTSNKSAELQFLKDAADTEDGENLGIITFYGENESNANTKFGHIKGSIVESDAGAEGGSIKLAVATHDGEIRNGLVINDGNAEDEIDVTIGDTATSLTTIAGTLTMGSTATLTNAGLLAVANQSNITGVGTISSGVWEGTSIATDQQKHILHYIFRGYSEGNGSTYEIPVVAHDNQAPLEHNISTGSAGTDALTVQNQIRTMGQVMPRAGTLKKWTGWITGEGSGSTTISLFKLTPADDSNSTVSPVLLDTFTFTAGGNARSFAIAETSFTVDTVSAGDTVFTGIKAVNAKDVYFTSTLEIEV